MPPSPTPADWPVLVTGAGGFVGGHVARQLARSGFRVRGLARRPPSCRPEDPPIEWMLGDLRDADVRAAAVRGMRGVIHSAAWVSLRGDSSGICREINLQATRELLDEAVREGVERFVLTSTLHTLATGTPEAPADETTPWNLQAVDSPYCQSKREVERDVLQAGLAGRLSTVVLCPGMVIGPRDPKPTSTRLIHLLARSRVAFLPPGGIPIVDASVVALAHQRALTAGGTGQRYAIVGPYLSYPRLAALVARISGRPRRVVILPPASEGFWKGLAFLCERWGIGGEFSVAAVGGGFLSLHVTGRRADACYGLVHPEAEETIRSALDDPQPPLATR